MALILEDGTQPAGANSYVDLDYADAYFASLGNTAWPAPVVPADPQAPTQDETDAEAARAAQCELALIQAARSLDLLYGPTYASTPLTNTQSLLWPRYQFYDRNKLLVTGIPKSLKQAQCEVALKAYNGEDITPTITEGQFIKSKSVSIDVISESVQYTQPVSQEKFTGFQNIDRILWPVLKPDSQSTVRLGL